MPDNHHPAADAFLAVQPIKRPRQRTAAMRRTRRMRMRTRVARLTTMTVTRLGSQRRGMRQRVTRRRRMRKSLRHKGPNELPGGVVVN